MKLTEIALPPLFVVTTLGVFYEKANGADANGLMKLVFECATAEEAEELEERALSVEAPLDVNSDWLYHCATNAFNTNCVISAEITKVTRVAAAPKEGRKTFNGPSSLFEEILPTHLKPAVDEADFPIIYDLLRKKLAAKQKVLLGERGLPIVSIRLNPDHGSEIAVVVKVGTITSTLYWSLRQLSKAKLAQNGDAWVVSVE
jgi:hypothetical protein